MFVLQVQITLKRGVCLIDMREPEYSRMVREQEQAWNVAEREAGKLDSYFPFPYSICNLIFLYEFIF